MRLLNHGCGSIYAIIYVSVKSSGVEWINLYSIIYIFHLIGFYMSNQVCCDSDNLTYFIAQF